MKLGVGLPAYLGGVVSPRSSVDWARLADEAGFHAVAAHDRPNHDTWEPLVTLAAVAPVTERVRLATTVVLLPPRDEVLVAKQAAVVDLLSGGRLDLGLGIGARADDYQALGRPFSARGRRFSEQLSRIAAVWSAAREREEGGTVGPAPAQRPRPPLWVGGYADAAIERAVTLGDAYLFGAPGIATVSARLPDIRDAARRAGRSRFPVGALAYVALSTDPRELRQGEQALTHYYGALHTPFAEKVHAGDADEVGAALDAYRSAGVDVLYLFPVITTLTQLGRWAEELLPRFATAGDRVAGPAVTLRYLPERWS
jgi:alkanesulfonate monooxygenase SsuD/methylene tetrahydromethanopterin reductase-like flavin-dependent oxidoreductase (luciferase family)